MNDPNENDILQKIALQAAEMLGRGERPQAVRVGQLQAGALDQLGHTGDTLTVAAPTSRSQTVGHAGQTNPLRLFDEVSLLVERTDATDQLEVHGYP